MSIFLAILRSQSIHSRNHFIAIICQGELLANTRTPAPGPLQSVARKGEIEKEEDEGTPVNWTPSASQDF